MRGLWKRIIQKAASSSEMGFALEGRTRCGNPGTVMYSAGYLSLETNQLLKCYRHSRSVLWNSLTLWTILTCAHPYISSGCEPLVFTLVACASVMAPFHRGAKERCGARPRSTVRL